MKPPPQDGLPPIRERIEQQRNTIEALKREGHECPDAERQLAQLPVELRASEKAHAVTSERRKKEPRPKARLRAKVEDSPSRRTALRTAETLHVISSYLK